MKNIITIHPPGEPQLTLDKIEEGTLFQWVGSGFGEVYMKLEGYRYISLVSGSLYTGRGQDRVIVVKKITLEVSK